MDIVRFKKRRVEELYNADVKCVYSAVFNDPEGVLNADLEDSRPKTTDVLTCDYMLNKDLAVEGLPVFKLWDKQEHVKPRHVSIFTLALYLENVTESTKNALRSLFGKNDEVKHMDLHDLYGRGQREVDFLGLNMKSTGGSTFLTTCITHGFLYRPAMNLTVPRFDLAFTIPRDVFVDTTTGMLPHNAVTYYFVVVISIPRDAHRTMRKIVFVRSAFRQYKCVVPIVQTMFVKDRTRYLDACIESDDPPTVPFGTIDRVGRSAERPIFTTLVTQGLTFSTVKVDRFTVEYRQNSVFF
ncbi:triplex capsid protein 1 [Elephant endotheliotropic herpesvirus 3B]|nr:triplex capsid protein 1 [Elephant endotheliotropic herpesvirus 3B]